LLGNFSEYFIHELCQEFFEYGLVDYKTPSDFRELLESIKLVRKDDIRLNDVLEKDKPDIDIHIKNKCAISFILSSFCFSFGKLLMNFWALFDDLREYSISSFVI